MKVLVAAVMLLSLAGCGSTGADTPKPARTPASGKAALPIAPPPPLLADDPIVCTADVKQCADGSYVSRNPNKGCAFARCPGETQPY